MSYKVLVVDDSSFFQERLKTMLEKHSELKVVGFAANGNEAIEKAESLKPDIISMDYEMPYLDGVSAVRAILAKRYLPIVMVSSMTYEGARVTLDALDAGAVDFIPKNFAEVSRNSENLEKKLHNTFLMFARREKSRKIQPKNTDAVSGSLSVSKQTKPCADKTTEFVVTTIPLKSLKNKIKVIVVGVSTGGPVALAELLRSLPANFSVPIIVIQHMPENFTKALAERLDDVTLLRVAEAKNGDALVPGHVYIAPGGHQLMLDKNSKIKILPGDERMNYKPSVDVAFGSAANAYGPGLLGIVLTGMGSDGCDGSRILKQKGGQLWAQDRESSVIYGMPKVVTQEGLVDLVLPLKNMGPQLMETL